MTYSFWTKFSNSGYSDIAPPLPSNYLSLPPSGKFMNQVPFYSYKHRNTGICMLYFCKTHFHSSLLHMDYGQKKWNLYNPWNYETFSLWDSFMKHFLTHTVILEYSNIKE